MRILFAGTPDICIPTLEALSKQFNVCGILTNPDRPQGRKKILHPSPVKEKGLELGISIFQPEKLDEEFYAQIAELKADILVCIAFGKIFRKVFLDMFPLGGINIHPSLLPKYRGPSPISEAIINGDSISGISIQRLAAKMDSGNILLQEEFEINNQETTGTLTAKVADLAAPLVVKVIQNIENDCVTEWPQNDVDATFCKLIKKDDGIINWNLSSNHILNIIRGYSPWPMAQTMFLDKKLSIIEAKSVGDDIIINAGEPGEVLEYSKQYGYLVKTGDGAIFLTHLQLQSKKALDYKSFNNGVKNFVGTFLGRL